jgi:hypothetical protein
MGIGETVAKHDGNKHSRVRSCIAREKGAENNENITANEGWDEMPMTDYVDTCSSGSAQDLRIFTGSARVKNIHIQRRIDIHPVRLSIRANVEEKGGGDSWLKSNHSSNFHRSLSVGKLWQL